MEIIYEKRDLKLFVADSFIYEITVYKSWKQGFSLNSHKYISANKEIKKYKSYVSKEFDGYRLTKYTDLVAAPLDYLENNHFKRTEYYDKRELRKIKGKKKKNNE